MADQITSLSIQISSDATRASQAIDTLISKLTGLSSALDASNVSGMDSLSQGVANLSGAMLSFKSVGANKSTFSAVARGLDTVSNVNSSGIDNVTLSLNAFNHAINSLKMSTDVVKPFNSLTTAITRLSKVNAAQISNNLGGIQRVMQTLGEATYAFKADGVNVRGISAISSSLQRLNSINTNNITQNIANIVPALQSFAHSLSALQLDMSKVQAIVDLGMAINVLNNATAGGIADKVGRLSGEMDRLAANAKKPSIPMQILIGTLRTFANVTTSAIRALGTFVSNHLPRLGQAANSVQPRIQSLGFTLWKLYAQLLLLRRIMSVLSKPVEIASNLIEIQNVVDHTFGDMQYKLNDFAKTSIKEFGMSELSVKRYASRFQAMGMAMDITDGAVANASGNLAKMGATLNTSGDSLADMSINLTKLTGDLASFFDEDQAVVAEKMNSVFTGMARPLRAYGIDLTMATLKEFALKNGLDANVESMTQAEKTMLRYQYVLAQTQHIAGDFERTSDTWANQIRMLKQNFEVLGATMGGAIINALKPVVKAINSAIQAVTAFAKVISDALGFIFGWKYEEGGGATGLEEDMAGAADAAGDLESGTGGAADNAKKLKSYLMGIDELNVIAPDDGSSGGGGGGGGGGGADTSGANADGGQWVEADKALKDYISDIGSLYELGQYISNTLATALERIDWQSVYEKARNFGTGLASFLNGLITPRLFAALGFTIAGALNTALHFLDSFGETFDFGNFGTSLQTGIRACLENIDWNVAYSALSNWGTGLATFLNNLISPELFSDIGGTIGNALNGALTFLNDFGTTFDWTNFGNSIATGITTFFSTTDFVLAAEAFNNIANGILTGLTTAIGGVDWSAVGTKLAEGVNSVNLAQFLINLGTLLMTAVSGAHQLMLGFILSLDWLSLGVNLTTGFLEGFCNIDWVNIIITSTVTLPTLFLSALQVSMWAALSEFATWLNENFGFVGGVAGKAFLDGLSKHFEEKAIGKQEFIDKYIANIRGQVGDGDAESDMGHTGRGAGHSFDAGFVSEAESSTAPVTAIQNYVSKVRSEVEAKSSDLQESGKTINDAIGTGITTHSSLSELAVKDLAGKLYTGMTTGNGTNGVNAQTYQTIANNAMTGLNTQFSTGYTDTQAPTETWAKGIITWFTGDGSGENKINKEAFTKFANDIITAFKETITNSYEQTKEPMDTWVKGLLAWFTGESGDDDGYVTKTTWTKFAETIITAFKDTIVEKYQDTKESMETWSKNLITWFYGDESPSAENGLGKKFHDSGVYVMEGLINGLRSKLADLREVCSEISDALDDTFEDAEEIGSPSKKWGRYGGWIIEGLTNEIDRNLNRVVSSATNVTDAIDRAYKPYMPTYRGTGYSVPSGGGKIDSDGIASGMSAIITSAVNGSSDTALMQQQNELLTKIANKNNNVYMDGKKTDALLKQAQKRKGFTFRPQLGNA